jgi:hypothetical protein
LGLLSSDGVLSGGGFGSRTLLRLLSGLLPSDGFGGGMLLGLLSRDGLLSGDGVGSRTLLRLPASGSFSRRTLLRSEIWRR